MFQIKVTSADNYQGCIRCQMHFNSGKKPGTQEQSQLPAQWVEITRVFAASGNLSISGQERNSKNGIPNTIEQNQNLKNEKS